MIVRAVLCCALVSICLQPFGQASAQDMPATGSAAPRRAEPRKTPSKNNATPHKSAPAANQAASPQTAPPTPLNRYATRAASLGAKSCVPKVQQVTEFLTGAGKIPNVDIVLPAPSPADRRMLSLSMALSPQDAPTAYASVNVVGTGPRGCDASYETILDWPKACPVVMTERFPNASVVTDTSTMKVARLTALAFVFLFSTENGCLTIKKEILAP